MSVSPIRVSEAASLALHASAIIAGRGGGPVPTEGIASVLGASEAHLSKVLQRLSRAGLVVGKPGPGGGFTLTKPARKITLQEIYEAIEGPIGFERCLFELPICEPSECPLSCMLAKVSRDIQKELGKTTLAELRVPRRAA